MDLLVSGGRYRGGTGSDSRTYVCAPVHAPTLAGLTATVRVARGDRNDSVGQNLDTFGTVEQQPWDFRRSAIGIRHMVQVGIDHGIGERRLLASTGLLLADLQADDLEVEGVQELSVARNLVQTLGDRPGLGTEVAMRFSLA